jgi:hypothetical protein
MGFLNRLVRHDPAAERDRQGVAETVERVMQLHPQLRLARRYQKRLAPAVATSIRYMRELVDAVPAAREASSAAWTGDPYIHAYFVAPDDVPAAISRSADLRAYFVRNVDMPEAYAVLGMELTERHILGVAQEGETLRHDVPQTTVSFSDHQVRMCGRTEAELKDEIVQRLLDQLALEGLARSAADKSRRDELEQERALLKMRLQLLERQGTGIRAVLGSDATADAGELARLESEVKANERHLADLGLREDALDRQLEHVHAVFAQPGQHLYVSSRHVRLDRMNVVLEEYSTQVGDDFAFRIARLPTTPPRVRAFSLIRFARADMLPEQSMFQKAAQFL